LQDKISETYPLRIYTGILLLLALLLGGFQTKDQGNSSADGRAGSARENAAAHLSEEGDDNADVFSLHLFHSLIQQKNLRNQLVPPLLVALTLSALSEGANGATRAEILKVLRQTPQTIAEFNKSNLEILSDIQKLPKPHEVHVARSFWIDHSKTVNADFVARVTGTFGASYQQMQAGSDGAVKQVNGWFSQAMGGTAPPVVKSIPSNDQFFTLDAISYTGSWAAEFRSMGYLQFKLHTGDSTAHTMMYREGNFEYFEDEFLQAVRLPYQKSDLVLELYLPRDPKGIFSVSKYIRPSTWMKWQAAFAKKAGTVILPIFSFSSRVTMPEVLAQMGIQTAFHPQGADFKGIFEIGNTRVGNMVFATFYKTTTEGAAIPFSAKTIAGKGFNMRVNHPFFYVVRHTRLNRIVIMGTVIVPKD